MLTPARTVIGIGLLTLVSVAAGYDLDEIRVEWWTGAGPNRAVCVVDFWPYNGDEDSFAFGCRFTGSYITGLDLLNALQDAELGLSFAAQSDFVTDIWYVTDGQTYHTGYNWPESYWSYWVSADFGEYWEYSMYGAGARLLHDGDTDGWLAVPGDDYTSEPVTPLYASTITGDTNCDLAVNFLDINPFVLALTSPAGYAAQYPECRHLNADITQDGVVDFLDINAFVALMQRDP